MYASTVLVAAMGASTALATAVFPSIEFTGYDQSLCAGSVVSTTTLSQPQHCITFGTPFTSASLNSIPGAGEQGCVLSFFTGEDCFRTSFIDEYAVNPKGQTDCANFEGKEAKSAVMNCPGQQ